MPDLSGNPETTLSLAWEARALAALRHPSIVFVFAREEHQGMPYVVMELLSGRTLEAVLDEHRTRGTSLPLDEVLDLLAAVADGIAAVHRAGIAHRDIKPASVMPESPAESPMNATSRLERGTPPWSE